MEQIKARNLWGQMCSQTVGADENGAVERITAFGNVATSNDLQLYLSNGNCGPAQEEAEKIAEWLESWAKAIKGQREPERC